MRFSIKYGFLLLVVLLFNACEDVIQISLKDVKPQVVIEGGITLQSGPYQIKISKTTDYFEPSVYPPVGGAVVEILDDLGNSEDLMEQEAGFYSTLTLQGDTDRVYYLRVKIEGKEYTGSSIMQRVVPIDSMKREFLPGGNFRDDGYYIHCFFTDPFEKGNNYRLIAYVNGTRDETIYLVDDTFVNGKSIDYFLYFASYQIGDTAVVELQSLDRPVYEYFSTLSAIVSNQGGNNPANPANPNTNLTGGALGYFGALASDKDTAVLKR